MKRLFAALVALSLVPFVGCEPSAAPGDAGDPVSGADGMDAHVEDLEDPEGGIDASSSGAVRGPGG